jgi:hypothetical protein
MLTWETTAGHCFPAPNAQTGAEALFAGIVTEMGARRKEGAFAT